MVNVPDNLEKRVTLAVQHFWRTREAQAKRQKTRGRKDQGTRGAVTGGAQMNGFVELTRDMLLEAGVEAKHIFQKKSLELPGYFRPTKEWDLLVVRNGVLIAALEFKSQIGPSFGNNFNNRTEEAMGSAVDLWTAFREGAFNEGMAPFLGYVFMLEDCDKSRRPVSVREPHFEVFSEFKEASYQKRYEIFCRKLVRERHYQAAAFITSDGTNTSWHEPAADLTYANLVRTLKAHTRGSNP